MKKRGLIPSQTRISVQDARTFNTAVGVAHENEEMRRIQLGVNRLADELDELKDAAKPTTPAEKNPVKDRIDSGGGGGDIIGGDTTINVVNNGGGGKWALTVISSIGRIFREKWVQALRFVSGSTGGPSQPYFKVPVAFTIESETIANDLKGDPTHPATQASIEANAYVDFQKALGTLRGRKSVYKDDSSANGYESLHGQPAILQYFELVNDEETPGNLYYYGTDDVGIRGYHDLVQVIEDYGGSLTGTENNTVRFNATGDLEETSDWQITGSSNESSKQIFLRDGERLGFNDTTNTYTTYLRSHATPTATTEYYLPPADGTSGQVLSTDGTGNLDWTTASGSDVLQTITLSANTTYDKSSLTGNILFLNTNNTATRTFTVGTGFVANDKLTFIIDTNSLGLINISINSRSISNNRGSILSFMFNGTNWISTNVYGWDLSTTNLANTIYGYNNQSRVNTQNTIIYGNGNRNDGESVVLGTNNSETSQNTGVITGKNNTSSGGFNYTYGSHNQITGGGTYNFTAGFDNRNTNGKSYTNTFGHGARVLHNGEIVYKIDNVTNFVSSGYNSHLRIVNFGTITTNATSTEIFLNDSSTATNSHRLVIPAKSNYAIKGRISAVQSDFSDIKHWEVSCNLLRDGSNNTSLQGSTHITVLQESTGATTWDILLSADNTNESLKVEVIGQASQTIYWKGVFEIIDLMLP